MSDVAGFLISLFAIYLAERPPTATASWGFHRMEVIGALSSVLLIWLLTGVLVYEAILRIITPEPVDGKIMFITACELGSRAGGGGARRSLGSPGSPGSAAWPLHCPPARPTPLTQPLASW